MKELSLSDLLNLADSPAQDAITDLWNQPSIHFLVVFTSESADFEIIGVGPGLPCATLEEAERHNVPGKLPEFYVRCPAAVLTRLQPKLGAAGGSLRMPRSPTASGLLSPSIKGRTTVPFPRPASASVTVPPVPAPAPAPPPVAPVPLAQTPVAAPGNEPPAPAPPTPAVAHPAVAALSDENREFLKKYLARLAALDAREHALAEQQAAALAELARCRAALDVRETELAAREKFLQTLLGPPKP